MTPTSWAWNPLALDIARWVITLAYVGLLGAIATYGLHRYWLVYLFRKHRAQHARPQQRFHDYPPMTVQLPMFNEGAVARRIIDAACQLDYPADKLQIQVLDDSTDDSADHARQCCQAWQAKGRDIQYIHREKRTGYKAGALAHAMPQATGHIIAIFDVDFVPPANFLRRTVHHFTDPNVGVVQTRWSHLNRDDSLLTRGQAIFLDGHFVIEHTARNRSGSWINFNGTAGLWRRQAIETAGGWQHDTLTEDVDLSYRAQLAGWRFVFLPRVACPAELPPEINAFKSQQHRWTKGSIQTALKLLPNVLRSAVPFKVKREAFFHLTSPMVYLFITLLAMLFYPAIHMNLQFIGRGTWLGLAIGMGLFALGTVSATIFYLASQRAQRRSAWSTLLQVPLLMAIGIGIALNNAVACIEALLGHDSPFVRTPKYNTNATSFSPQSKFIAIPSLKRSISLLEIGMGFYMLACIWLAWKNQSTLVSLPFLALFASGYLYVGLSSLWVHWRSRQSAQTAMA